MKNIKKLTNAKITLIYLLFWQYRLLLPFLFFSKYFVFSVVLFFILFDSALFFWGDKILIYLMEAKEVKNTSTQKKNIKLGSAAPRLFCTKNRKFKNELLLHYFSRVVLIQPIVREDNTIRIGWAEVFILLQKYSLDYITTFPAKFIRSHLVAGIYLSIIKIFFYPIFYLLLNNSNTEKELFSLSFKNRNPYGLNDFMSKV